MGAFEQALAIDPTQSTALERLAEIDLSRQAYGEALAKLQKISTSGNSDAVSRLLLGDAMAANGDPQGAAVVVENLPFSQGRLLYQAWYRYHLDGDAQRENWARQAADLLK